MPASGRVSAREPKLDVGARAGSLVPPPYFGARGDRDRDGGQLHSAGPSSARSRAERPEGPGAIQHNRQ
jgi:hypothetical protein